ncbi:hypothetical protein LCGC14_1244640 [marine sediment metagenome]|uniref:Uncharacterized protein n=1 Tax=marine sediment metagenome TaxID=412755 RepID=A0A0F9LRX7_9ZZZZ
MDEIPDPLKKVLLINAILTLILAFIYLGIFNLLLVFAVDSLYNWVFGGTLLILGIFALLVGKRKDLKQIKLLLELLIVWEIMILFIHIYSIRFMLIPLPLIVIWVNNAIFLVLIVINVYFYRMYLEKNKPNFPNNPEN